MECVANLSTADARVVADLSDAAGGALLDVHTDADHNRSVFTLAGPGVETAARSLASLAVSRLDLSRHRGAHPRIGVVDVVPFVPLGKTGMAEAVAARDSFASWASTTLGLPCFLYGPERDLPYVRRHAFNGLVPDLGPPLPHPSAGAVAVGARPPLVAYNLWLASSDLRAARRIAAAIRQPGLRALGLELSGAVQVSVNLLDPLRIGPPEVYDLVAAATPVARAELVGLLPEDALRRIPPERWCDLDLAPERTIEYRLRSAAHSGTDPADAPGRDRPPVRRR